METALVLSFGIVAAFFVYLGRRLSLVSVDDLADNSVLLVRVGEVFSYSFAGLLSTILMYLTMEFSSAASYAPVVRTVFVILQVVLGLVSGVGAFVGALVLVVLAIYSFFRGGKRG